MGDAADPREPRRTFIVPAIKPFDHYDFSRAKIACNLAWLVAKAFGTGKTPTDARVPRSCRVPGAPPCVSPAGAGGDADPEGTQDPRDAAGWVKPRALEHSAGLWPDSFLLDHKSGFFVGVFFFFFF